MNTYQYTLDGVDYTVEIESVEGDTAQVKVNDKSFTVKMKEPVRPTRQHRVHVQAPKSSASDVGVYKAEAVAATSDAAQAAGEKVYAPLPGTVTEIKVNVGDQVKAGDTVVVLEAMKMQNSIEADTAGRITAILVRPGDTVMEGAALVAIG